MVKYTQVMPVVDCSDQEQLELIMERCGVARALTYNQLGSLKGWGLHWKKADPIVRKVLHPSQMGLPSKLFEWSVSDCFKAITAQQEAAKTFLIRKIYQHTSEELQRKRLLELLDSDPTTEKWLHRQFRKYFIRGHTFLRNQVVYQSGGYKAIRLSRYRIKLEVQGLVRGKRITLIIKSNRLPVGQIRVLAQEGKLFVHTAFNREIPQTDKPPQELGMDKGYTEGFYLSDGRVVAPQLGEKLTQKTERINKVNKNRTRLYHHALNHSELQKRKRIGSCNLGRKVQSRKLQRDKAEIKGMLRYGLRQVLTEKCQIYVEDLSSPIPPTPLSKGGKGGSKRINRKLNQWMKGELQASLEEIGRLTGSTVKTVNAAYTSQVDYQTGTLLGCRVGDRFTRYTGEVLQSDYNAAKVILHRGTDEEIHLLMKYGEVRQVLLHRTVRYLHSIGYSVESALAHGWLSTKFKSEALTVESEYPPVGYRGSLSFTKGEAIQLELPL